MGVQYYLTEVLIYISLATTDTEHLFISLFAMSITSWVECLFKSFPTFNLGYLLKLCKSSFMYSRYVLCQICVFQMLPLLFYFGSVF